VKAYIGAAEKAHADPDVKAKFDLQGMEAVGETGPAKLLAEIKVQAERWRKIIDETQFKPVD
jgi:tripartite-type tricarboxylate transporter receptor subunit TctC